MAFAEGSWAELRGRYPPLLFSRKDYKLYTAERIMSDVSKLLSDAGVCNTGKSTIIYDKELGRIIRMDMPLNREPGFVLRMELSVEGIEFGNGVMPKVALVAHEKMGDADEPLDSKHALRPIIPLPERIVQELLDSYGIQGGLADHARDLLKALRRASN